MKQLVLKLYVTGTTPRSEKAIQNVKAVCEGELAGKVDLQVIDILEDPQLAEREKIIATPTLIKEAPPPVRRVIGDMTNKEKVFLGLEIAGAITFKKAGKPPSDSEG